MLRPRFELGYDPSVCGTWCGRDGSNILTDRRSSLAQIRPDLPRVLGRNELPSRQGEVRGQTLREMAGTEDGSCALAVEVRLADDMGFDFPANALTDEADQGLLIGDGDDDEKVRVGDPFIHHVWVPMSELE